MNNRNASVSGLRARPLNLLLAALAVLVVVSLLIGSPAAAQGSGPDDALLPIGENATLLPHSQVWYKFDYGGDSTLIAARLNSYGEEGITFKVYTPQAIVQWAAGNPLEFVGASSSDPNYDQVWEGRFNFGGTFYIIVENKTAKSIGYTLTVTGEAVTTLRIVVPTATPFPNPFKTPAPVRTLQSGGRIVLQESSGGAIYTFNPDGTDLRRITVGLDPTWSPDGTRLAFARQAPVPGLFIISADGTGEYQADGGGEIRSPAWSRLGTPIVYAKITSIKPTQPFCFFGRCFGGDDKIDWSLKQFDVYENTLGDVPTPAQGAFSVDISPDGDTLVYVAPGQGLMLGSLSGRFTPWVINTDGTINSPRFSPEGSRIAYMVRQPPVWQVVVARSDGGGAQLVTQIDPLDFVHPNNVAPFWSPDGRTLVYLSDRNGKWEFFAVDYDGRNERQVLKNVSDALNINYQFSAERVAGWRP